MTADLIWPMAALPPLGGRTRIVSATVSGGRSLSGKAQAVASDAGYYALPMQVGVRSAVEVRAWNALEAILGGRQGTVMVPALGFGPPPWPVSGGVTIKDYGSIPFSDQAYFSDGSGFHQNVIQAVMEEAVAVGDVTAYVRMNYGSAVEAGMSFQADEQLFRAARAWATDEADVYEVRLALPARVAVASGDPLNFDLPMFRATLASDDEMALDTDGFRFGTKTVNFEEDC